ncbi:hypothetical protein COCCADRAFT_93233, partial [Bipolaris zeicola 26-R-13]
FFSLVASGGRFGRSYQGPFRLCLITSIGGFWFTLCKACCWTVCKGGSVGWVKGGMDGQRHYK